MNDSEIIGLYFRRDESAIAETSQKYGKMLTGISYNVLCDRGDAEECVNDTYLTAWDTIPPEKPEVFSAYLAKIVKNHSIDRYRKKNSMKRKDSTYALSLDELSECVSGGDSPESAFTASARALSSTIAASTLPWL